MIVHLGGGDLHMSLRLAFLAFRSLRQNTFIMIVSLGFMMSPSLPLSAQQATRIQPVSGMRDNSTGFHALVGARVVTTPGRVMESATIVIRDGLIQKRKIFNYKALGVSGLVFNANTWPFNDIDMLEKSYNIIKSLNFENLEILQNV